LFWDGEAGSLTEALDLAGRDFARTAGDSTSRARRESAACLLGLWHAERASADTAALAAAVLEQFKQDGAAGRPSRPDCAYLIRAMLAVRGGDPQARNRLDSLERVARSGELLEGVSGATNLLLARLYSRLGDHTAARLAATRFWYWGRTMYVSPYHYQAGVSALEDRDSADARTSLLRVSTLWAAGDSSHRLRADSLRRLAVLLPASGR
jgi:hypothetical protein